MVIAAAVIIATSVVLIVKYGDSSFGFDTYIDDYEILDVIKPACDDMTEEVEDLTVTGTLAAQAKTIELQNKAVTRMLTTIRKLPTDLLIADEPTVSWLSDWESLLKARNTYVAELKSGHLPELEIPTDRDGYEVTERMDWASEPDCVVPEALLDPFPVEVDDA